MAVQLGLCGVLPPGLVQSYKILISLVLEEINFLSKYFGGVLIYKQYYSA